MMKFNREEGLTLIELLITIAVIAIVAAIAVPVVSNVVANSNTNALAQTNSDVVDFVTKYNNSGVVDWDGTGVLKGYVDLNGNNIIDTNELVESLTIDTTKFEVDATTAPSAQSLEEGVDSYFTTTAGDKSITISSSSEWFDLKQ